MPDDQLMEALEEDARAQAGRILEEAREAAAASLQKAREEAEREREERLFELTGRLKQERAARLNAARTKASGLKLGVRLELVGRALDEAVKRLTSLPEQEYSRLLNGFYDELLSAWEKGLHGEAPVVYVNPADIGRLSAEGNVLPDEKVKAGVVFTSGDGRVRFENTVEARLERGRKKMVPALNEMLFNEVM
ncbi:MAG TPA: hypothetical protein DDW94_10015 [Deltaproteobacteria bacterium]|nr:MAG: hypothetical protein A2Z79_12610 [Deltaproteobacteria bacterium GWA2_55_82]OGQ64009.1 MAG: hypothetical protein A3I81_08140 [Deltaproteobacteria bacterium RIFCSPLOWO2_02_FULL_55_12]OIJ73443.1 MAG: hypothetical protein A2V21_303680 [Deltaproteobacteria bacterium GWC2_55_46]HBG47306.1 hypothetical protein [Deltaproteobacteria bacterium]HCY10072.1 hypothetical protein [Deltaproteobacteria bacterium]